MFKLVLWLQMYDLQPVVEGERGVDHSMVKVVGMGGTLEEMEGMVVKEEKLLIK